MSSLLKLRRGSTVAHETFTGADGEVTFNTDTNALVTHDGATAGGFEHTTAANLAASTGSSLVGYLPAGTGAVATDIQSRFRNEVWLTDFGASPSASASVNTAALLAAVTYVNGLGGGVVHVPYGNYAISEFTFGAVSNVVIEGEIQGYTYSSAFSTSSFTCTSGVFAIRISDLTSGCGLRNIGVNSNGVVSTAVPYIPSTYGVEYGVLIENGLTIMEGVSVQGFQYGCVLANAGNSNIFDKCSFSWNTKVGFACTIGSAAAYALYHPNLTPPTAGNLINTTTYTMKNCNLRRNAWGMILRDGNVMATNVLLESNVFGGLLEWVGSIDSSVGGVWNQLYAENNWLAFTPTLTTWATSSVTGNNLLKNNTGVYIPLVDNASNALSDFGYQITMGAAVNGTSAGPQFQKFTWLSGALQASQKAIFIKQALQITFDGGGMSGGDQSNLCREGYASGGFLANAIHWYNWQNTLPTPSNRGMQVAAERSASQGGGLTASVGYFRGLAGSVLFPSTPSLSADPNMLDNYVEGSTTLTLTGCTTSPTFTVKYTIVGRVVTLTCASAAIGGTSNSTAKSLSSLSGTGCEPSVPVVFTGVGQDGGGGGNTIVLIFILAANGIISIYPTPGYNLWTASGTCVIEKFTVSYCI